MGIIDSVVQLVLQVITQLGYPGIAGLMALESVGIPVPSEVVMPAGGWLASAGTMNLFLVTIAGTIGCVAGSAIGYWIGFYGGRTAVIRYGQYMFLNEGHLDWAERWFTKYGAPAVFLTRMVPIVRTYISYPAGMAKMRFWPFIALSATGSAIWCFVLAYIGFLLGPNWNSISGSFNQLTIAVLLGLGIVLSVWYLMRRSRKKQRTG
jgi:membrane protein DedA with SNARE-associated domain